MNGPAEQPVWERPWSLEEIRRSSQSWSLGADAGLLNFLREFSQQTISRTHDIEKQLDGLIRDTKATDCRLHNVFNDFLMLSNTQFIENRVYDEEIEEHIVKSDPSDKPEQEKTREQKEAELIPKVQEAVNYGLQVLETAFEQLDIKAGNSDSEEEEANERVELILEPKDLYIDRPLPYLIGSQLFMQQEDVGLGDLSSEEGSIDNDRGSIIDSEEEDDDDDNDDDDDDDESNIDDNSEDEKKLRSVLSDEDEDNGSDLFGDSDKEEDEENDKSTRTRTKSFADELAARIQGDVGKKQENDRSSISSLEVKTKKEREKREVKNLPSEDEDDEDDIFKPPKLTDEDFSPFGSKGGLFSGGKGLFDDDEEGDLFSDVQNKENRPKEVNPVVSSEPTASTVKKKPPVGGVSLFPGGENVLGSSILADKEKKKPKSPAVEAASKLPTSSSLFDDEDAIFAGSETKQIKTKPVSDLFVDDDDLFEDSQSLTPPSNKAKETEAAKQKSMDGQNFEQSKPPGPITRKHLRGLFSDEDDSETDLFSPSQTASQSKTAVPATKTTKTLSLFDDEEEEDLFVPVPENKPLSVSVKSAQQKTSFVETKDQKTGLFSSDEEDLIRTSQQTKTVEQNQSRKDAPTEPKAKEENAGKSSLFYDEMEDDLFAITKESQKKPQRVSLLFEDDNINHGPLFSSDVTPPISAASALEQPEPSVPTKSIRQDEKDSLFGKSANNVEEKKIDTKTLIDKIENKDPALQKKKTQEIAASEPGDTANEDLFAASPPTDKHQKTKGKNVLSLFDDDEDDNFEDQPQINNNKNESRKPPSEKSSHGKSTGVFQDEELLFSDELQKDNDPDVDLFASTKKPLTEKSKQAKPSPGVGLFGDDDEDDLFSASKPQKPPKVHEKKTVIRKESSDTSKDIVKVPDAVPDPLKESVVVAPEDAGHPAGPAPIKAKSASSRIGKLQANLHINPAAMLPGAVPKLPGARPTAPWQGLPTPAPTDGPDSARMPDAKISASEAVSFEKPAQIDTLHNANKTRAKVAGKRRPPTRMGRKSVSQDEDPIDPLFGSSHSAEAGPPQFNQGLERTEHISTMKLSLSENDVQSKTNPKTIGKSLTPDVNDLFGSDLFAKSVLPKKTTVSRSTEVSPDGAVTSKSVQEIVKKSPAVTLDDEASDDDLFHAVKQKSNKAPTSTAHLPEAEDDLFGDPKPQKKDSKPTSSDIFEQDIFSTEAIKPVKKAKEKKPAQEASLFDDNLDIFADLTHKPKEKKTKKKVESKSIFDDDMDDIFSSGNQKKPKPKAKSSHPTTEKKSDQKAASTFDDPLNVLGK